MTYKKSDEDVKRLAEVIFTGRMAQAKVPKSEPAIDKLVDSEAYFSLCGAQAFCECAEGWFESEDKGGG